MMSNTNSSITPSKTVDTKSLPLLLENLKKVFGQNIKGPVSQREREYKATLKPGFMFDVAKFLNLRGVKKLAAIQAWESEKNIDVAYHFISQIGKENLDSKITIISFLPKNKREIGSIKKLYPNALQFEKEIALEFNVAFKD